VAAPLSAQSAPATPPSVADTGAQVRTVLKDIGRIVAPNGIDEGRFMTIGGVRQWVQIRGQDRRAPLLLFLHGGPGSPVSDIAWSWQRPWEDYYTVVNWDQRGFGRSMGTPEEAAAMRGTLNRKQITADAIALIEALRAEFGQTRIILVGQSWGSSMAIDIAAKRPDLLHAVVLQGLVTDMAASPEFVRQRLIEQADAKGDTKEAARLRDVGPPPETTDGKAMVAWARKLGVPVPDPHSWHNIKGPGDGWARRIETLQAISPDLPPEDLAAQKARAAADPAATLSRYQEVMGGSLGWTAERDAGSRFKVPVIVMQGAHDWQAATPIARAYFDTICAPWKKWVTFPHAAHALNIEQPGLSVVTLANDVLPAARGARAPGAQTCAKAL
jgi:pimeloyl-ACP methyl ester carboxylesterase